MTIAIDHAHFTAHARTLASRADAMAERRVAIEHDVEQLLAAWRGAAADHFAAVWREWRDGADSVVSGLAARTDELDAARGDLAAADAHVGEVGSRLRGRLG